MLNCETVSKDKPSHGILKLPHVSTEFLQPRPLIQQVVGKTSRLFD